MEAPDSTEQKFAVFSMNGLVLPNDYRLRRFVKPLSVPTEPLDKIADQPRGFELMLETDGRTVSSDVGRRMRIEGLSRRPGACARNLGATGGSSTFEPIPLPLGVTASYRSLLTPTSRTSSGPTTRRTGCYGVRGKQIVVERSEPIRIVTARR